MILVLYALTMFVGATLLFVVQPMVGKMILPLLGGSPAVWSTCMLFFQAALLGGYAYAHASSAWLGASRQALLHLAVLAVPLAVLPLGVSATLLRGGESSPVLDVLVLLSVSVGLPFLAVSATAPLLQQWFTRTGHRAAGDPYFLYAASNLGSMLALLSYPTLIEPRLQLRGASWLSQTRLWTLGYLLLAVLIAACALALWVSGRRRLAPVMAVAGGSDGGEAEGSSEGDLGALSWWQRLRWLVLALVPSSLLLGVTTYVTTDVAAVPLLWVLPLAIYLLTFILAFGRWPARLHRLVVGATLPAALAALFLLVSGYRPRIWMAMLEHFALLLVVALACHGELARDRPAPARLTEYYLLISVGGVLGGVLNALVAPLVFPSLLEYPLAMVLGCMLVSARYASGRARPLRRELALAAGAIALGCIFFSETFAGHVDFAFVGRLLGARWERAREWLDPLEDLLNKLVVYGPPLAACFALRRRPAVLGTALAALVAVGTFVDTKNHDDIRQARSFFGVLHVSRDRDEKGYTELRHGTTLHGRQSLEPARRAEPVSYYHRAGPVGAIFSELDRRTTVLRMAAIGLGTGTMAAYARPGDAVTFYEIDRLVRDIALDPRYFTYVADAQARAAILRIEIGDARVRMDAVRRERPGEQYDLIAVDAFSSDAIPVHLLTREAVRLYLDRLAPDGVLAVHVSNRYLDLEPVVANLAEDAGLGGRLLMSDDSPETKGAARSTWIVLARSPAALGGLLRDARWEPLRGDRRVGVWTDDFHNLLSVFKWH